MLQKRQVRLFRNGRNQALRIPRDLELPGRAATLHQRTSNVALAFRLFGRAAPGWKARTS